MHHLIVALVDGLLSADRANRRSVRSAIPEVDELLAEPGGFLAKAPVVIGPARHYTVSGSLGLLNGCLILCVGFLALLDVVPQPHGPGRAINYPAIRIPWAVRSLNWRSVAHHLGFALVLCGGTMTLTQQSVTLCHRSTRVICPWTLFLGGDAATRRGDILAADFTRVATCTQSRNDRGALCWRRASMSALGCFASPMKELVPYSATNMSLDGGSASIAPPASLHPV